MSVDASPGRPPPCRYDDLPPLRVFMAPGAKSTIPEAKMQKLASGGRDSKAAATRA